MTSDSITMWVEEVKQGNNEAARRLWNRYFPELVKLARKQLAHVPRRMEDEEDVALSALDSFCRAADRGRFPELHDREGLWRLLASITHRKVVDLIRRTNTNFGDARVGHLESSIGGGLHAGDLLSDREMSADVAAIVADQLRRLLQVLPDPQLRKIAMARMDGMSNKEIAEQVDCAVRTVERRLAYIRKIWKDELETPGNSP